MGFADHILTDLPLPEQARFDQARGTANLTRLAYRPGYHTACPGCGKSNWLVGRTTAECGYCATALPLFNSVWSEIRLRAA